MKTYLLTSIVILSLKSWAGVSTSGGGYAVVCRDSAKTIVSAELLDLVEARQRYHLTTMVPSGSALQDFVRAVENSYFLQTGTPTPANGIDPKLNFKLFMERVEWVASSQDLDPANDLGDVSVVRASLGSGCGIEQVAYYDDSISKVKFATEIWSRLDSLSQSALISHELSYEYARHYVLLSAKTSEESRLETAITVSENLIPVHDGIPANATFRKVYHDLNKEVTSRYDATIWTNYKIPGVSGLIRVQFTAIGGRGAMTKTYVDMPSRISFGDKYYLQGVQFAGWYVLMMPAQSPNNLTGVTVRIFNNRGLAVTDIQ